MNNTKRKNMSNPEGYVESFITQVVKNIENDVMDRQDQFGIYKFDGTITVEALHHMIQDLVSRQCIKTENIIMLMNKEGMKELVDSTHDKQGEIKELFGVEIISTNKIDYKVILIGKPKKVSDFVNSSFEGVIDTFFDNLKEQGV